MPIYAFRCRDCGHCWDELAALGATNPRPCQRCQGEARLRLSRVAVRYSSWGFAATDSLVRDTRGKDFRALRETAEQISED